MIDIKAKRKYIGYVAIAFFFAIVGAVAMEQYFESITCKDCILDNPTIINYTFPGGGNTHQPVIIPGYSDMLYPVTLRALGTEYTTGNESRLIQILYDNSLTSGDNAFFIYSNDTIIYINEDSNPQGNYLFNTAFSIIPPHSRYTAITYGCCSVYFWFEQNLTT